MVGTLALAASGIASAMTRRPDAFDLQHRPVAKPLIMSHDHQFMNESSPFGNTTSYIDAFSNATKVTMDEYLIGEVVADIGGKVVARGGEIKQYHPEIFAVIDKARTTAIAVWELRKNKCAQSCDRLKPVSVNATELVKGLIDFRRSEKGIKDSDIQNDVLYGEFLFEKGDSRELFAEKGNYINPYTKEEDHILALLKNPCYLNNLVEKCLDYILVEQSPEGKQRDRDDNRPPTYAATAHPVILFVGGIAPVIFTTEIQKIVPHPVLFNHIFLHEVSHYTGLPDIFYAGIDRAILNNSQGDEDKKTYMKHHENLRAIMPDLIKNNPDSMQPAAVLFFDTHVRDDPGMGVIDKMDELVKRLASDDKLWFTFMRTCNDFKTMELYYDYLREQERPLWASYILRILGMRK